MLKDVLAVIVPQVDSMRESLSVLALHGLPQSSSASRLTAGASGFLNFNHSGRHNKATARDNYPTASRLGIIKHPLAPRTRGGSVAAVGAFPRVPSSAESRCSLPRTWN